MVPDSTSLDKAHWLRINWPPYGRTGIAGSCDRGCTNNASITAHSAAERTTHCLGFLETGRHMGPRGLLDWVRNLLQQEGYAALEMDSEVRRSPTGSNGTTRCPIRIDGDILVSNPARPVLWADTEEISNAFWTCGQGGGNMIVPNSSKTTRSVLAARHFGRTITEAEYCPPHAGQTGDFFRITWTRNGAPSRNSSDVSSRHADLSVGIGMTAATMKPATPYLTL